MITVTCYPTVTGMRKTIEARTALARA